MKNTDKKQKTTPKLDAKIERVQAKHTFTPEELIELGRWAGRLQRERDEFESQLSSIKSDYKGKIESAESLRGVAFGKLADGFEMREVEGIIIYNEPKKGWKTIRHHLPNEDDVMGEIIRTEPMSNTDLQKELQLIEAAKSPKIVDIKSGEPLAAVKDAFPDDEPGA